ncbi:MAG: DUF1294 domain-containing protein [Oscillospiraceae bacterium]|nr:DUF1294 domain-containing protein [Oscillospiraceae bacterium]
MKEWFFPQVTNDWVWAAVGSPVGVTVCYLVIVNLWAFGLMWFDKRRAKRRGRRIRERTLFLSALLGGSVGAVLGMWVLHHKTKHWYFVWGMPAIFFAQAALAVYALREFA